jgi:Na+/H+-dicarboxylate symporter
MSTLSPLPASRKLSLKFPFYIQILLALALGLGLGGIMDRPLPFLADLSKVILQIIKALATPLLFFSIVESLIRTQIGVRTGGVLLGLSGINAIFALGIGMGLSNWLRPGETFQKFTTPLSPQATALISAKKIDFSQSLLSHFPSSVLQPFVDNALLSVILLAVLLGSALRILLKETQSPQGSLDASTEEPQADSSADLRRALQTMAQLVTAGQKLSERSLHWAVKLVPIAVFSGVTKTVSEFGFSPFQGLLSYLSVALLGLLLQILLVYQLWLWLVKMSLPRFWVGVRDAVVYALGASSSLATLPITLKCLKALGVSERSARLSACVGTNLNNDGILLYEAMAVLFVAQASGIDLSLGSQILAALGCVVAGIGIAGIPEAGLISLALVLSTVGLPLELLPILLTVDWILSRARAITNVIADHVGGVVLDYFIDPPPAGRFNLPDSSSLQSRSQRSRIDT